MRVLFAVFCWTLIFILAIIAGVEIFGSLLVGFALWALATRFLVTPFLVSVPEITGLVTINLLTKIGGKTYYCYPTGMHFRFPWEQVKVGNYINLRLVTDSKKETYPAIDGPLMLAEWSFQYKPLVNRLDRYIAVDETTINKGLVDVGSAFLSAEIASLSADECKKQQSKIARDLVAQFEAVVTALDPDADEAVVTAPDPDAGMKLVEKLYGIEIVRVALADLDYSDKYQKARESERVAVKLKEIADKLKRGDIGEKDALNAAMIINGDIKKSVQEVEGQGGQALAALLMAMSKGGKE